MVERKGRRKTGKEGGRKGGGEKEGNRRRGREESREGDLCQGLQGVCMEERIFPLVY